jgi:hypothetical protein
MTNVSGGTSGSGTTITNSLTGSGTAVYTITPTTGTCVGPTATLTVNVEPCSPFQSCNLVVYRIGDGSTTLNSNSSSAFPVAIQEISPTGQIVQTISGLFTGSNLLTQSGNATSVGMLNSYNGLLALPGLNSSVGTSNASSENTKVTHIINGQANLSNRIVHPTSLPMPFNSDTYRSVIPLSTNTFYCSGDANNSGSTKGVYYYNASSSNTFEPIINFTTRNIEIFNGQLYYSTASNSSGNIGIYALGSGLPTSTATATPVITYPASSNGNGPYGFSISPDGCTAYIADDGSTNYEGISKWTKNTSGNWAFQYKNSTPARGLIVDYSGLDPIIYATTTETSNNKIIKIVDNGSLANSTIIASAGSNYRFAGIDFTPNSTESISIPDVAAQLFNICQNGTAQTLTATGTSSSSLTYQWYSNTINNFCGATAIPNATSPTYTPPTGTPDTIYYFLIVKGACSNYLRSTMARVIVHPNPTPNITGNAPLCSGSNINLTANPAELSYSWTPNGQTTQSISVNATGTYGVTVTDANGCTGSISTTVSGATLPSIISISPP